MPKNVALLSMLKDPKFWTAKDETKIEDFREAIDALLAVDPANEAEFRQAIQEHAETWGVFDDVDEWVDEKNDTWFGETYTEDDYYEAEENLEGASFPALQQQAAAQRVKLKLDQQNDKDILLNILKNNEEACRAYLAEKIAPELKDSHLWNKDDPEPEKVLTDDAIADMRKPVAARWAKQAIAGASLDVLNRIFDAEEDDDLSAFRQAIKELGLPDEVDLKCIDMELVFETIEEDANKRRKKLMADAAMHSYEEYVNGLTDDKVYALEELLNKEGNEFRDGLEELDYRDQLTAEDVIKLREKLGERFIKIAIAKGDFASFAEAFKKDKVEEFNAELLKVYPEHSYITKVITTKEQMDALKANIASHAIPELHDAINGIVSEKEIGEEFYKQVAQVKALDNPKMKLSEFQAELAKVIDAKEGLDASLKDALKAALSVLKPKDMAAMQQLARERRLDVQLDVYSTFGQQGRHQKLVDAFRQLSVDKQREFLENNATKDAHPDMPHIMRATELSVLRKYFPGVNDEVLKELQKENTNNKLMKGIHNSQIKNILLAIEPPITLTETQVQDINKLLKSDVELSDGGQYIALVKAIKNKAGIAEDNKKEFFNAFGLNDDGSAIAKKEIQDAIDEQHENNKALLIILEDPDSYPEITPELASLLVKLEKKGDLGQFALDDYDNYKEKVEELFRNSDSPKEFIENYMRPLPGKELSEEQKALKEELKQELSGEVFRDIKNAMRRRVFEQRPEQVDAELSKLEKSLKGFEKNHKKFAEYMDKIAFVPTMTDVHIYNPVFQKKSEEMEAKFTDIAKETDVIISQLNYDRNRLQGYLDSIPDNDAEPTNKVETRIQKVRKETEDRIAEIDRQLVFFNDAKKHISESIIPAIKNKKTQNYAYKPDSVETYLIDRDKVKGKEIQSKERTEDDDLEVDQAEGPEAAQKSKFELDTLPPANQVRCFDVTHRVTGSDGNEIKVTGRFIYDRVNPGAVDVSARGDKVSKNDPGKYIIRKFPQPTEGVSEEELRAAKINFAMTVATQVLAGMNGPPSKDNPIRLRNGSKEELEYMWTAFAILGDNVPGMKFGTDAIRVASVKFDPAQQKGRFFGYSSDSLYETHFKNNPDVKAFVDHTKEHASSRYDNKGAKSKEGKLTEATSFFKKELNAAQKETDERKKEHGHTSEYEPPTSTPNPGSTTS